MLKQLFLGMMLFFFSCAGKNDSENKTQRLTAISFLSLSSYSNGGKNWDIKCLKAEIDESKKIINCEKPFIVAIGGSGPDSQIKGEFGVLDLNSNNAFIREKVKVISLKEKMTLYSSKFYFDSS